MSFEIKKNICCLYLHHLVVHLVLQEQKINPCLPVNVFLMIAVCNGISMLNFQYIFATLKRRIFGVLCKN